jgi:hypothetical protein
MFNINISYLKQFGGFKNKTSSRGLIKNKIRYGRKKDVNLKS